mgnify:CR=1 FL=1
MSTQTDTAFEAAVEATLGRDQTARGYTGSDAAGEQITPLGASLRAATDGTFAQVRRELRTTLAAGDFLRDPSLSVDEARAWTSSASTPAVSARYIAPVSIYTNPNS